MPAPTPEALLIEVDDLLRTMPARDGFGANGSDDHFAWLGRAEAVVTAWNSSQAIFFSSEIRNANSGYVRDVEPGIRAIITWLRRVQHDLRLRTGGPRGVAVNQGNVFDYFDEVRKVIEQATSDIMFVDPYLDAEFVKRYLPHVKKGVSIRLMARERMSALLPAVELFQLQSKIKVEVRSVSGFHDRYVFIDQVSCYQSGASFSEGAMRTPTTLTPVTDIFAIVQSTYEDKWKSGTVRP